MGEVAFILVVFVGVIAVTTLLFGGWVIVAAVQGVARALGVALPACRRGSPSRPAMPLAPPTAPNRVRCARPLCHAENPAGARYCHRCGSSLSAEVGDVMRRAAVT